MSNMENKGSDKEVMEFILQEVRYIRQKLDDHIEDERASIVTVRDDLSKIKEEMKSHQAATNTKIGIISGGISLGVAAVISWALQHLGVPK